MSTLVIRARTTAPAVIGDALATVEAASSLHRERQGGVLAAIVLAILCALVAALLPAPAEAGQLSPTTIIYGIASDNNIYSIDPGTGLVTGTVSTASLGLSGSTANAFALDRDRAQIYFLGSDKNLYYWDRPSNVLGQVATAADLGLSGSSTPIPRNATFFNDKFWFIGAGDNLLRSALITYGTSGPTTGLPTGASLQTPITISGVAGTLNPNDLAYDPDVSLLYGSDFDNSMFQIDVSNLAGPVPYTSLYNAGVNVQLAFDKDFATLYGVSFGTGQWYTMDTTVSGTANVIAGAITPPEYRMADLAGGLAPVPEPGTMALAGSGILMGGVMIYRNRRRRDGRRMSGGHSEDIPGTVTG